MLVEMTYLLSDGQPTALSVCHKCNEIGLMTEKTPNNVTALYSLLEVCFHIVHTGVTAVT